MKTYLNGLLRNDKLLIKEVKGIENLEKVKTGAIITSNHFNPIDTTIIQKLIKKLGFKIVKEEK